MFFNNERIHLATLPSKRYFTNPFTNLGNTLKTDLQNLITEIKVLAGKEDKLKLKIKKIKNRDDLDDKMKLTKIIKISLFQIEDEESFSIFLNKTYNSNSLRENFDYDELENLVYHEYKKYKCNLIKATLALFIGPLLWFPLLYIPYFGVCLLSIGFGIGIVTLVFEIHNCKIIKSRIERFLNQLN
ncbi:MAG: hypothetical protein GY830_05090 [Bacteroidetes bacterium]|nr:hypothetical protein [Bacteroidota bacterium]